MRTALIVVDLQNDFMEGGVLAAKDTLSLIDPLNQCIEKWMGTGDPIVFTRDWHPESHWSFETEGGPWPVHCVKGTPGAEIYSSITIPPGAWIIDKGIDRHSIGYSDFGSTQLEKRLWAEHITHLAICGIATEYCIKADVLDALALGFRVTVLVDLIRPIDAHNGDAEKALTEMEKAGALLRESAIWMR